jgi:hypothetical protein
LTGQESRQQLYTMLTRGRHANHLYLQVVGDGDPDTVIRPDTISPRTPTETLQQILARDEAPVSASTLLRELNDPAARLFQAVRRYTDGLHVATEQLVGPQSVAELDQADHYIPALTTEPGWPTLRAHLLALAAETGEHPLRHMLTAASGRDLSTAGDMAAVSTGASQSWRLSTQGRCPGSRAFHQRSRTIPCGAPTWQSDPSKSPTSPTRFTTTPAKVTPGRSGLHREVSRAHHSSVTSQCGAPPTASIPKTRDQQEEPNSKRSRPSGNNASTGTSRGPPTRQQMRGPTSEGQDTLHLVAATTTGSARTRDPNGVRAVRPRLAGSTWHDSRTADIPDTQHTAESGLIRSGPPSAACGARPRFAAGRAAYVTPCVSRSVVIAPVEKPGSRHVRMTAARTLKAYTRAHSRPSNRRRCGPGEGTRGTAQSGRALKRCRA